MDQNNRNMIIVLAVAAVIIIGGWLVISSSSGVKPPFTVIESHSMQHCQADDKHSEIGVIDTGDMILVRSLDKTTVTTYVEGSQNGYQMFGDYGDVIIYKRTGNNPVIHRAFIWLEYNGSSWSAPSLAGYAGEWYNDGNTDYNNMTGSLTFYKVGVVVPGGKNLTINLDTLSAHSGYLTVGDSVSNIYFDQSTSICPTGPVTEEMIKSVAWKEIPWLGAIKLMLKGNSEELNAWASNSKTMLVCEFATIFLIVIGLNYLVTEILIQRRKE